MTYMLKYEVNDHWSPLHLDLATLRKVIRDRVERLYQRLVIEQPLLQLRAMA